MRSASTPWPPATMRGSWRATTGPVVWLAAPTEPRTSPTSSTCSTTPTLARTLFPVGHLTKDEVRAHAARLGLATADKPDSQDVCFITATGGRTAFLGPRLEAHPGTVVDQTGEPVGHVAAVELVTIGQRHGLGLPGGTEPRYVVGVDVAAATVTVGIAPTCSPTR